MHGENAHQQSDVAGAIHREDAKTVFDRGRPLLEECDQQHRSDAHDLPSGHQQVERTGGEGEQRSECEQVQQQKEAEKAALAMQVGRRELPDQSREHDRHGRGMAGKDGPP